jgi:hypothetical protein
MKSVSRQVGCLAWPLDFARRRWPAGSQNNGKVEDELHVGNGADTGMHADDGVVGDEATVTDETESDAPASF